MFDRQRRIATRQSIAAKQRLTLGQVGREQGQRLQAFRFALARIPPLRSFRKKQTRRDCQQECPFSRVHEARDSMLNRGTRGIALDQVFLGLPLADFPDKAIKIKMQK